jgi:hypothetical protein
MITKFFHLLGPKRNKGFALLIAVLVSSVVLAVGISMLNITLKEYLFSGIGRESEIAFYSADAGMECALYWDTSTQGGKFDLTAASGNITCMGSTVATPAGGTSGTQKQFQFEWASSGQTVCTKIGITKYFDPTNPIVISPSLTCAAGATCTQVESRGYNRPCAGLSSPKVVERALRANY